jgi:hypothetical protein
MNLKRYSQESLGGIVSLIALNGPLGLQGQIPIRTRLRAAGAFNDIELGLTEVHEANASTRDPSYSKSTL